jgi:hypothetical protein
MCTVGAALGGTLADSIGVVRTVGEAGVFSGEAGAVSTAVAVGADDVGGVGGVEEALPPLAGPDWHAAKVATAAAVAVTSVAARSVVRLNT